MKSTELARQLRKPASTISGWIRQGRFKAVKVLVDHKYVWEIDDKEAIDYIKNYGKTKQTNTSI